MVIKLTDYKNKYVQLFLPGASGFGRLEWLKQGWVLREAQIRGVDYSPLNYLEGLYSEKKGNLRKDLSANKGVDFVEFEIDPKNVSAIRNISDIVEKNFYRLE